MTYKEVRQIFEDYQRDKKDILLFERITGLTFNKELFEDSIDTKGFKEFQLRFIIRYKKFYPEMIQRKQIIECMINLISSDLRRDIMKLHYLDSLPWDMVASKYYYSSQYMQYLQRTALEEITEKCNRKLQAK